MGRQRFPVTRLLWRQARNRPGLALTYTGMATVVFGNMVVPVAGAPTGWVYVTAAGLTVEVAGCLLTVRSLNSRREADLSRVQGGSRSPLHLDVEVPGSPPSTDQAPSLAVPVSVAPSAKPRRRWRL